jgi:hypothetical protein
MTNAVDKGFNYFDYFIDVLDATLLSCQHEHMNASGRLRTQGERKRRGELMMQDYSEPTPRPQVRRYPDKIGLIVSGVRPDPKSSDEILAIAEETEFFEEGRSVRQSDEPGATIEYTPRAFVPNAIREAFFSGLLLYKFSIVGAPPPGLSRLSSGTYYLFLDFAEGPDQDARWIGRIVNTRGAVECIVPNIEVKERVEFHEEHIEEHGKPRIVTHGAGFSDIAGAAAAAGSGWVDVHLHWEALGAGCWTQTICIPET